MDAKDAKIIELEAEVRQLKALAYAPPGFPRCRIKGGRVDGKCGLIIGQEGSFFRVAIPETMSVVLCYENEFELIDP